MNALDLFLREHAFVHAKAVALADSFNMDYLWDGLTDREIRMRPGGLNSLAWLLWHMARVEDGNAGCLVGGRTQVLDEQGWAGRLNTNRRDVGTGMTSAEVNELSETIDLQALWAYRNEVGRRTRALAADLWPDRWLEPITVADIQRGVAAGLIGREEAVEMEEYLPGKSREAGLFWWGLNHSLMHLGQAALVRKLVIAARS